MTTTPLRFACANIERDLHLHRVEAFIEAYKPDVLCLQEIQKKDLSRLMDATGHFLAWAPQTRHSKAGDEWQGLAIISRHLLTDVKLPCYRGNPQQMPYFNQERDYGNANEDATNHYLLTATVHAHDQTWVISTVQMPVTVKGAVTPAQLQAVDKLIHFAQQEPELILAGDFNAPRGKKTFSRLAAVLTDNIPAHYTSSIDGELHRSGPIPFMVDGLFTTPHYRAENVRLQNGVSDHCAIVADIFRT